MHAELMQKKCSKCEECKPVTEFYKVAGGSKPRPECKKCTNDYHKKYRKTETGFAATKRAVKKYMSSPEKVKNSQDNKADWARFNKYGITREIYDAKRKAQNYCCQICKKHESSATYGLVVDHDHITGKVRDLLCSNCNKVVGFIEEDFDAAVKLADYLKKYEK